MAPTDERLSASPPSPDIPLVAASPPPETRTAPRTDWALALIVCAFAFLLASFPARNSDLWQQLAAGSQVVRGEFPPSSPTDPRAAQTWLSGLVAYGVYSAVGGPGLVIVKALLVVGLALVLLRLSWTGHGWWVPAACTLLALLAMSTRLLLQPATVSYLFLAVMLWLLRPHPPGSSDRPVWPLVVLFLIWANTDTWFTLGLATVALIYLGRILDEGAGIAGRLTLSFVLLSAACLVNPLHVHACAPPPQLGWFTARPDAGIVTSPFQNAYLAQLGTSPAALAYYPLLSLSLFSFFLVRRWSWQRLLPWAGLALLSAVQVRAIPFFAVVAGPVLAWNLQEAFAAHLADGRPLLARALTVLFGVVLFICAWPGWLQVPPFEPRRWAIETVPSLERSAVAVRRWHEEGKLGPDDRGLHLSPETASAFAWFCPQDRGFVDAQLAAALRGQPGAPDDWADRMRTAGVNHIVVHDTDRERLGAALDRLLADPKQWPLLYLEGGVAVFGWRDPGTPGTEARFRGLTLDIERLAFAPGDDQKAPRRPGDRAPEARRWWEALWKPAPPRPIDREEAILHLFHADILRRLAPYRNGPVWPNVQAAGLVGAAAGWSAPGALVDALVRSVLMRPQVPQPGSDLNTVPPLDRIALLMHSQFRVWLDDTPPALLYLAIRAARRALAINPEDAAAHLALGQGYLALLHTTRERAWAARMPELVQLRRAEASTALNRALALNPDNALAHFALAGLYRELGYLDLTLHHLQAFAKLTPVRGGDEERARFDKDLQRLAKEVDERLKAYNDEAGKIRVYDRAMLAAEKGLAGKARDVLLGSDVSAFGTQGMALQLELQLRTGRAREVIDWTEPAHRAALGAPTYHWLRTQALAALGEYELAEEEFVQLARAPLPGEKSGERVRARAVIALLVGQAVLEEAPAGGSIATLLRRVIDRVEFVNRVGGLARALRTEANVTVLRGLLALEEGEVGEARRAFRQALAVWRDETSAMSGAGLDFNGRPVAQSCLGWLE